MSWHDPSAPGKPRRLGLYLPYLLLLTVIVGWSIAWLWLRGQVQTRLEAAASGLGRAGYQVTWSRQSVGGYPFRLDVTLGDVRVHEPSGWGLTTPLLEAEAYAYAPGHWMFATPQGLTFERPQAGAVRVAGKVLRASLSHMAARPPSFDLQGEGLTFQPAPGAQPFALQAADLMELHLRAGPDDQGGVFVQVGGGRGRLEGLLGRMAGDKPIAFTWNATLSKMSAFTGDDWAGAVRRWSDAGGLMTVRDTSQLTAGDALVQVRQGALGVGADGRLTGSLEVALRQAPRALGAMAATGMLPEPTARAAGAVAAARQEGEVARAAITFQTGRTTLGPVALGLAPRIYTPR
jgi:hypothetical protein